MAILSGIKHTIIDIDPEDVINQARKHELDVQTIPDFRNQTHHYDRIEEVMDDYRSSFVHRSALGGLTTGIGGFTTAVTFAGINTVSLAISLYRLAQRFAVLNGFEKDEPLQQDKILNIYFEALGVNAGMEAGLKSWFMKAGAAAEAGQASKSMLLRLIIRAGRLLGKRMSAEEAGSLIPVAGGLVGATANYSFAQQTGKSMKKAFRRAYFNRWLG